MTEPHKIWIEQCEATRGIEDELLYEALNKVGVESVSIPVQSGGHGNFGTNQVAERMRQFFDKHLRGKDVLISGEPIKQGGR